jgi:hypothetical protein
VRRITQIALKKNAPGTLPGAFSLQIRSAQRATDLVIIPSIVMPVVVTVPVPPTISVIIVVVPVIAAIAILALIAVTIVAVPLPLIVVDVVGVPALVHHHLP